MEIRNNWILLSFDIYLSAKKLLCCVARNSGQRKSLNMTAASFWEWALAQLVQLLDSVWTNQKCSHCLLTVRRCVHSDTSFSISQSKVCAQSDSSLQPPQSYVLPAAVVIFGRRPVLIAEHENALDIRRKHDFRAALLLRTVMQDVEEAVDELGEEPATTEGCPSSCMAGERREYPWESAQLPCKVLSWGTSSLRRFIQPFLALTVSQLQKH